MDKEQLINELKTAIASGTVKSEEVLAVLPNRQILEKENVISKRIGLSEIFYYIGGIIVLIGLIVLVAQNWISFSYAMKVFVTFGLGLIFFGSALLLRKNEALKNISTVFLFLSAVLIPFGYFVMFVDKINSQNVDFYNILISFLCLFQFSLAQFALKNNLFTIFNTIFGTWLFFTLTNTMIGNNPDSFNRNFHLYQIIIIGISYFLVGYYLNQKGRLFANWLNSLGVIGILGSGFALNVLASDNYNPEASVVWIILYPIMIVGSVISSVYLKNSALLFVGTFALIGYIIRITAQHFTDTLGWPFALIVMGIVIMGLGYLAFHLNKKYIKN